MAISQPPRAAGLLAWNVLTCEGPHYGRCQVTGRLGANSPAEIDPERRLRLRQPGCQLLCLLQLHRPAPCAELPERVDVDEELITGDHQFGSAGQQLMEALPIGVKARVMATIDLVVQAFAGMTVAEALHLLGQAAPHGPWPWLLG